MAKVWIDQELCTGDGICVEICPSVFGMHDDGLAYVKEVGWSSIMGADGTGSGDGSPALKSADGMAELPAAQLESAVEAAEECPGECIFFEA